MRTPGPGAIQSLTTSQDKQFVQAWNKVASLSKDELQGKKREDLLMAILRKNSLIKNETKPEQVRAYAAKLRKEGYEIKMREVHKLGMPSLKVIVAAWQKSATPKDAFELCVQHKIFVVNGETEEELKESRKEQFQKFRSTIAQLQKKMPLLKKMGTTRVGKIDNDLFIKVWNESNSVSEVLKKLKSLNVVSAETEKSSLRSKAKTLNKLAAENGEDPPCKKFENNDKIDELMSLLEDADAMSKLLGGELPDDDEDDDDDDDDDDSADDDDDENAEIGEEDAKEEEDDDYSL